MALVEQIGPTFPFGEVGLPVHDHHGTLPIRAQARELALGCSQAGGDGSNKTLERARRPEDHVDVVLEEQGFHEVTGRGRRARGE